MERDRGTIAATTGADGVVSDVHDRSGRRGAGARCSRSAIPTSRQQSLRGNAVFRWEYRPGSVLYVAWTQSRVADRMRSATLDFTRDRRALLAARPDNIFLVKASWWLPR